MERLGGGQAGRAECGAPADIPGEKRGGNSASITELQETGGAASAEDEQPGDVRAGLGTEESSCTAGAPTALAAGSDLQPGVGRCHAGDTARKGYPVMRDDDTVKNYLFDLGGLIKEYALAAVAERERQSDRAAQEFYDGYVQGFHRVVSLMQQQAQAFGIDLKDLQLEGVQPDRDLV
jgi:hypothetical protein